MPFPAVVNDITFSAADFDGLAYSTGLPNSVQAMGDHGSRDLLGTSTTNFGLTAGVKAITTNTNRAYAPGMTLTIANSATNYATATVQTYVASTGALSVSIAAADITGAGSFSAWNIYPIQPKGGAVACDPLPISRGGIGRGYTSTATSRFQDNGPGILSEGNPAFHMQEVFDDFNIANPFTVSSNTSPVNGYQLRTKDADAGILIGATYAAQVSSQMKNRPGQFAMKVKNSGTAVTLTHGSSGYLALNSGGSIYFATQLKTSFAVSGEEMTILAGLKSHQSSSLGNIFDFAGIGFRYVNGYQTGSWECLVAEKGSVVSLPVLFASANVTVGFRADPNNQIVEFYVISGAITGLFNSKPIATIPLPSLLMESASYALLHPAISFQKTLGEDTRYLYCEYLYCAKNLRR